MYRFAPPTKLTELLRLFYFKDVYLLILFFSELPLTLAPKISFALALTVYNRALLWHVTVTTSRT